MRGKIESYFLFLLISWEFFVRVLCVNFHKIGLIRQIYKTFIRV